MTTSTPAPFLALVQDGDADPTPVELEAPNLGAAQSLVTIRAPGLQLRALYLLAWKEGDPDAPLERETLQERPPLPEPVEAVEVLPDPIEAPRPAPGSLRAVQEVNTQEPIAGDPEQLEARARRQARGLGDPKLPPPGKTAAASTPIDGRERRRQAALEERNRKRVDGFTHDPADRRPQEKQGPEGRSIEGLEPSIAFAADRDQVGAVTTWRGHIFCPTAAEPSVVLDVNGDTVEDALKYLEQLAGEGGQVFGVWDAAGALVWPPPVATE